MGTNLDSAGRGYDAALCNYLSAAGATAVSALAWSAATGTPVAVAPAVAIAGISAMAWANNCYWDPEGPSTLPPGEDLIVPGSCILANGCGLRILGKGGDRAYIDEARQLVSVKDSGTYPTGARKITTTWIDCNGITQTDDEAADDLLPVTTELIEGFGCRDIYTGQDADPMNFVYEYTDAETNCTNNFDFQGFMVDPSGNYAPVFDISPAEEPEGGLLRLKPISGCNFNNVVIFKPPNRKKSGGDDPPIIIPPGGGGGGGGGGDDDDPWWLDPIINALPYLAFDTILNLADLFFNSTEPKVYRLEAPCNKDPEGNPAVETWVSGGRGVAFETLDRVDNLSLMIQQHLSWKHLVCKEQVDKSGDLRTISFISDETSPFGKSRLRKRLRYRSKSGVGSDALVTWWKDFTWSAGSVCVYHKGSSLGTPQVWAASIDEGKRVIRHAAGEAGVDPDQVGEWGVSGSNNPRFGVQGTMRVNTKGGYYWITDRLGSDNRPLVAKT